MSQFTPMTPERRASEMPIAGVAGGQLTIGEEIPEGLGLFHSLYATWDAATTPGSVIAAVTTRDSDKVIPVYFAAPGLPVRVSGTGIVSTGKDFLGKTVTATPNVTIIAHFGEKGA